MTIKFRCPECSKSLNVNDEFAGKKARCPDCQSICLIPVPTVEPISIDPIVVEPFQMQSVEAKPVSPTPTGYFIDSHAGETYGPVSFGDLKAWFDEGRVTSNCFIRDVSDGIPRPASHYFPQLAAGYPVKQKPIRKEVSARGVGIGEIFSHVNGVFWDNNGVLVGATVITVFFNMPSKLIEYFTKDQLLNWSTELALIGVELVLSSFQLFIAIGFALMCFKIAKGKSPELTELFSGGRRFWPVFGWSILVGMPVLLVAFGLGFFSELLDETMLTILFIGLMAIMTICALVLWPGYYLVIDNKTSVFGSFGPAVEIGGANVLTTILLIILSVVILILGLLALIVGVFVAAPFVTLLWATAYLKMSNQL